MREADAHVVHWTQRRVKKSADEMLPCIPSLLDDYGLTAIEFRVFCRIGRRAGKDNEAWESVPSIATACGLGPRSVRYALKLLVKCNLLTRRAYAGETSVYSVNPPSKWKNKSELEGVRTFLQGPKHPARRRQKHSRTLAPADRGGLHHETGVALHPKHRVVLHLRTDEGKHLKESL